MNSNATQPRRKPYYLYAAITAAVIIAMSVFGYLNWSRGIHGQGETWQYNTIAKYQAVQTKLSTCLDNTSVSAQVAQQERSSLKDTLAAVIQARYPSTNGTPVDITSPQGRGIAINVIKEAYPDISPALYQQLMTTAVGCRNEVSGAQQDLQDYAARFKSWTNGGDWIEGQIRDTYPNNDLQVKGLNGTLTGKAALDFIAEPVTTQEATNAMQSKTMPQQQLFPSASPSK